MGKPKGSQKTGGRRPGAENRVTKAFKGAVLLVFDRIGGVESFATWAKKHPTQFYQIAARLIPHEVVGPGAGGEHLIKSVVDVHEA